MTILSRITSWLSGWPETVGGKSNAEKNYLLKEGELKKTEEKKSKEEMVNFTKQIKKRIRKRKKGIKSENIFTVSRRSKFQVYCFQEPE